MKNAADRRFSVHTLLEIPMLSTCTPKLASEAEDGLWRRRAAGARTARLRQSARQAPHSRSALDKAIPVK